MADRLYDEWPKHWTGRTQGMCGLIRVDGKPLRFMGKAPEVEGVIDQQSVVVRATRSIYNFRGAGVDLTVTFTSPLLMDDLDLLSRPASYVTFSVESDDGKPHQVQIYFDATAEWAVNTTDQIVEWRRPVVDNLAVMSDRNERPARAGGRGRRPADRLGLAAGGGVERDGQDGDRSRHAGPGDLCRNRPAWWTRTTTKCRERPTIIGRCCRWRWIWEASAASRSSGI